MACKFTWRLLKKRYAASVQVREAQASGTFACRRWKKSSARETRRRLRRSSYQRTVANSSSAQLIAGERREVRRPSRGFSDNRRSRHSPSSGNRKMCLGTPSRRPELIPTSIQLAAQ